MAEIQVPAFHKIWAFQSADVAATPPSYLSLTAIRLFKDLDLGMGLGLGKSQGNG